MNNRNKNFSWTWGESDDTSLLLTEHDTKVQQLKEQVYWKLVVQWEEESSSSSTDKPVYLVIHLSLMSLHPLMILIFFCSVLFLWRLFCLTCLFSRYRVNFDRLDHLFAVFPSLFSAIILPFFFVLPVLFVQSWVATILSSLRLLWEASSSTTVKKKKMRDNACREPSINVLSQEEPSIRQSRWSSLHSQCIKPLFWCKNLLALKSILEENFCPAVPSLSLHSLHVIQRVESKKSRSCLDLLQQLVITDITR